MEREGRMKEKKKHRAWRERNREEEIDGQRSCNEDTKHGEFSGQVFLTNLVIAIPGTWEIRDKVFRYCW